MAFEADRFFDRRRLKKRLTFWRIAAIIAIVLLVVVGLGQVRGLGVGDNVAVLNVSSIILDDPKRDKALMKIVKDAKVKALIVRINSPGGTVVGGESLYLHLRQVAEKKPVVAVLGELATSAGYMTAIGADHIVARRSTITGSIGVLMQSVDLTDLLDRLGIKPELIKSSPLKATPNPVEKITPEARRAAQDTIDDMYNLFVDMVAERRNMARDEAKKLADGRVYTGRQAIANGLIDGIGGEKEARDWLAATKNIDRSLPLRAIDVREKESAVRKLLDDLFGISLFSERLRLDGLISLWHPSLL